MLLNPEYIILNPTFKYAKNFFNNHKSKYKIYIFFILIPRMGILNIKYFYTFFITITIH